MQPYQSPAGKPKSPQDPWRLPRRQIDPEDIVDIIRRNRSWLAAPTLAGLVLAVVIAFLWPDTYVSTSVIRVVPPQVPANFVPTNVATQMSERINSMAQTILSRGTLTSIIETYGLYPRQRNSLPLEDIIEDMKGAIHIGRVRSIQESRGNNLTAFQVEFAYENRYLAQKVCQDLVSRFINENTRERANQSAMTTQFLKDQWQAAKNELDQIERELTEFRIRNAGQLPDQWGVNIQQLSALEARLSNLNGNIGRLNQEKLMLESQIRMAKERIDAIRGAAAGIVGGEYTDPRLAAYNEQIKQAERQLTVQLQAYTANHPDVRRYEAQIELLRKERDAYIASSKDRAASAPAEEAARVVLTPEQARELQSLTAELQDRQLEIQAKDLQIEEAVKEVGRTNQRIAMVEQRLQAAPVGQQEYATVIRDYDLAKRRYDELNTKMSASEIATDLENRKQGETLELLDPASLPERPTDPARPLIIVMGLLVGLGIGVGLVLLREMKDTTLKSLKDVRAYTQLVVLGSVPLLENDLVVMRRRRMAWLAWTTACLFAIAAMTGSIYYYYATKV